MDSTNPITIGVYYTLELNHTEDGEPYFVLYYKQQFSDGDADESSMSFEMDEARALRDALTALLAQAQNRASG